MHMVNGYFHFFDSYTMRFGNLAQQRVHAFSYLALQDALAVLGCPDQMILRVVDRMRCSTKSHRAILQRLRQQRLVVRPFAAKGPLIHPAPQAAGHSERFS